MEVTSIRNTDYKTSGSLAGWDFACGPRSSHLVCKLFSIPSPHPCTVFAFIRKFLYLLHVNFQLQSELTIIVERLSDKHQVWIGS